MSPQETSIKHSALGWVKKSIDEHLSEIKTNLRLYIEAEDEALLEGVKEIATEIPIGAEAFNCRQFLTGLFQ